MKQLHIVLENENIVHKEKEAVLQKLESAVSERKQLIEQLAGVLQVCLQPAYMRASLCVNLKLIDVHYGLAMHFSVSIAKDFRLLMYVEVYDCHEHL